MENLFKVMVVKLLDDEFGITVKAYESLLDLADQYNPLLRKDLNKATWRFKGFGFTKRQGFRENWRSLLPSTWAGAKVLHIVPWYN